jgi:hypothetical protein
MINSKMNDYLNDLVDINFLTSFGINPTHVVIHYNPAISSVLKYAGWANAQDSKIALNIIIQSDKELIQFYQNDTNPKDSMIKSLIKNISQLRLTRINNHYLKEVNTDGNFTRKERINEEFLKIHSLRLTDKMKDSLDLLVKNEFLDKYNALSGIVLYVSEAAINEMAKNKLTQYLEKKIIKLDLFKTVENNEELAYAMTSQLKSSSKLNEFLDNWHFTWKIKDEKNTLDKIVSQQCPTNNKQKL